MSEQLTGHQSTYRTLVGIVTGAVVICALAACGIGSQSNGSVSDPNKAQAAYQACLQREAGDRPNPPDDAWLAKFRAASQDCQKKTGYAPPTVQNISQAQMQQQLQRSLKFAQCMRQHGINMPDPQITQNGVELKASPGAQAPDPQSPAYKAAQQACQGFLAQGTGTGG